MNNYMKYTQYAYLIAGVILLVDGGMRLNEAADNNAYLILAMGVVAIGLFFFRRKFAKKFDDKNKNQ